MNKEWTENDANNRVRTQGKKVNFVNGHLYRVQFIYLRYIQ